MNRRDGKGKGKRVVRSKTSAQPPGEREKGKEMTVSGKGNGPLSRDVIHRKRKKKEGKKASRIPSLPLVPIC
jgi:hypothetical protein